MKTIPVKVKPAPYEVLVEHGLLAKTGKLCAKLFKVPPSRWVVVTSPRVRSFWGKKLEASLAEAKLAFAVIEVDDGETAKKLSNVEHLLEEFAAARVDRASAVIALGGGVIGDMAGFAASVYMRGIPVVQIPTTLLAQVDAAIGGKTGVNLGAGKNLAGTFHQPKLVISDPEVLSTLDEREFRAGMFEVIKSGAIRSKSLFDFAREKRGKILKHDAGTLERIVAESAKIKAEIVAADERESDLRRVLNFGHTIGHALEAATEYKRYLHGEAVGWGMVAAAHIGVEMGVTSPATAARVTETVQAYGPLPEANLADEVLRPYVTRDKKTRNGTPHFVLLKEIGKTVIANDVTEIAIERGLQAMRNASAMRGHAHA